MRTNIEIDDKLMQELLEFTGLKTKKAVVDLALRELRRKQRVEDILALAGKVEFWPGYDYKALRKSRVDDDWDKEALDKRLADDR
jgi:Arc/MetJ family transcription regulator